MIDGEYEIEGLMRQIRNLDATDENDFAINKPQAFEEQLANFKGGFTLADLYLLFVVINRGYRHHEHYVCLSTRKNKGNWY